jgi:hypothetical protein
MRMPLPLPHISPSAEMHYEVYDKKLHNVMWIDMYTRSSRRFGQTFEANHDGLVS